MSDVTELEQYIESLYSTAEAGAKQFSTYTKAQVEKIVSAVVAAAEEKAEFYAEWAVRETGFGNLEAKIAKNLATSVGIGSVYDIAKFVEPSVDHEKKIITIPKPAGIVLAPMPCTNPIMTVNFKVIANLVSRNSVILAPHPAAVECCVHATKYLNSVAIAAGAPEGVIQILEKPSIEVVNRMMQDSRTSLIMATGGPALVHAAYSSGNPAIGVGPANVPCYVDASADIAKAGACAVIGNSFDYGLPCTCESTVLAEESIADELKKAIEEGNGWFATGEDEQKLREFLFPGGVNNPAAIGKSAQWIGEQCGVVVPAEAQSMVIEIDHIGYDEPVSKEKMFPMLGFHRIADGVDSGIESSLAMLDLMGKGHSAVIHTANPESVAKFTAAMPVCRVAVNTPGMTGSAGLTTNLAPTGSIGTGFFGGSSADENIGPQHLVQHTFVAYDSDDSVQMGDIDAALGLS